MPKVCRSDDAENDRRDHTGGNSREGGNTTQYQKENTLTPYNHWLLLSPFSPRQFLFGISILENLTYLEVKSLVVDEREKKALEL